MLGCRKSTVDQRDVDYNQVSIFVKFLFHLSHVIVLLTKQINASVSDNSQYFAFGVELQ